MHKRPNSGLIALILASLCLAACAGETAVSPPASPESPIAAAPTLSPPAPLPTATPEPEDLGEGLIKLVQRGFESILDYHIAIPEPRPLLMAAWRDVSAEARARGVVAPPQPALSGERDEMWRAFEDAYLALLRASPAEAAQAYRFAALSGMTKSLNDCHTFFLQPVRSEVLTDIRTGRGSGGVGLELAPVRPSYVRETISGGPAQNAGVMPGDYLLAVDGQDVTALGVEVITELLRGDPGSSISIQVRRPSTGVVLTIPITRALVRPAVADGRVLGDGIGYLRIRSFTAGPELRQAIDRLVANFEAAGVTRWVLDLRDNPGGDSDLELAARFVGNEVAERTLLRGGGLELREGEGELRYEDRPLAVLVNGSTASVAEIFVSMLQDHGRARIFGSQTNRCAGFVALETYPDGSTLGVTIARSLTPVSERPLWQTGVVPDAIVRQTNDDIAAGRDPVLDEAAAWLRARR